MFLGATIAGATIVFVSAAVLAQSRPLSPGEVRIRSRTYRPAKVIRAEAPLVSVEVVVRDAWGQPVAGLTRDRFEIFDHGKQHEITSFSAVQAKPVIATLPKAGDVPPGATPPHSGAEAAKPNAVPRNGRWIGLFFDDLNTLPGDLMHAKVASSRFIREATTTGDYISVITASGGIAQPFTTETMLVLAAVARVEPHLRVPPGGLAPCPRITAYEAYEIMHNDPSAFKAKVDEACQCAGGATCSGISLSAASSAAATSGWTAASGGQSAYGGSGALSTAIETVKAQAQQTWDQAKMASQATLEALRASMDQLSQEPGKRILLLASSGFLSGDLETEEDAIINDALHADIVINSLDAKGLYSEAPGGELSDTVETLRLPESTELFQVSSLADRLDSVDSAMARFAESTGGLLFRNNNDLDFGFYKLGIAPAYAYELGFPPVRDGKYHKIKVVIKNGTHDFVQARPGYFAPSAFPQPSPEARIEAEVTGSDERTDFPAAISAKVDSSNSNLRRITVETRVDIRKLPFARQKDRHVERLTFVAALFNSTGRYVTGKEAQMDLALKPDSFAHFLQTGIGGSMSLDVPPGQYRLRVVVHEGVHQEKAAHSESLDAR